MTDAAQPLSPFPAITRSDVFMIGTKRLWLRWPRKSDATALARVGGHPDVAPRIGTWPEGATPEYAAGRIERIRAGNTAGTSFAFVITVRGAWSEPVGLIGIAVGPDGNAMLGYHVAPEVWGRGYAGEALGGLLAMTRLLTRLPRVTASVMLDNPASARVLARNGFVRTGAGTIETPFRGLVPMEHFERELRATADLAPARDAAA